MRRGAEYIAVGSLTAMFGVFLLQVFARYVLNSPLGWTVEACVILYIWTVFWVCAFLLTDRDHVAFRMMFDALPAGNRRILKAVGAALVGLGFAAALPEIVDYVTFMKIDVTPVTRIRFDYVYSIFVIFAVAVVVRSILTLVRVLGPGWRQEVATEQDGQPTDPLK